MHRLLPFSLLVWTSAFATNLYLTRTMRETDVSVMLGVLLAALSLAAAYQWDHLQWVERMKHISPLRHKRRLSLLDYTGITVVFVACDLLLRSAYVTPSGYVFFTLLYLSYIWLYALARQQPKPGTATWLKARAAEDKEDRERETPPDDLTV